MKLNKKAESNEENKKIDLDKIPIISSSSLNVNEVRTVPSMNPDTGRNAFYGYTTSGTATTTYTNPPMTGQQTIWGSGSTGMPIPNQYPPPISSPTYQILNNEEVLSMLATVLDEINALKERMELLSDEIFNAQQQR